MMTVMWGQAGHRPRQGDPWAGVLFFSVSQGSDLLTHLGLWPASTNLPWG